MFLKTDCIFFCLHYHNKYASVRCLHSLLIRSQLGVLPSAEVGHELPGLLDVGLVVEEAAPLPRQVPVRLVAVQVTVTQRVELKSPVPQFTTL